MGAEMSQIDVALCAAHYVAEQVGGHVVLFALGVHSGSGGVVFFRRESGDEFPPRFSLWHIRHSPGLQVLTPFSATMSFQTMRRVESIEVVDARGVQQVRVSDTSNAQLIHAVA